MAGALTPKYVGQTILAGARLRVHQYGRYISIISATPATLTLSIDDEGPQQIVSGTQIDCEDQRYTSLTFHNTGGVACVLIALISNKKVADMRGDALFAAMVASLAAIDVDTSNINAGVGVSNGHLNTISGNIADSEALLTAIDVDTGNIATDAAGIHTAIDAATSAVSTDGGFEVLAIAATTAGNGANQACREAMFWTFEAHVHFKLGTTDADGATTLLVAEVPLTFPIHNTDHLRFYNGDAAGCTVYIIWRN
jgi:hypothetical protein